MENSITHTVILNATDRESLTVAQIVQTILGPYLGITGR
jgi:hypothetical protein